MARPDSAGDGLVVLAVDDEPNCLDEIQFLLRRNPRVKQLYTAASAAACLNLLRGKTGARLDLGNAECPMDLIFLDISMPGLDGMELARLFASYRVPPALVFVTGYAQYAFDAFKLGAFDYIEKPPDPHRVDRALRLAQLERAGKSQSVAGAEQDEDEVIPVELAGTTKLVPRSAIRYVEAQGDYVRLHLSDGSHLLRRALSQLEEEWSDAGFVRIHRSFLVALSLISELRNGASGHTVLLGSGNGAIELPVSRRHTRELKDRLIRSGATR